MYNSEFPFCPSRRPINRPAAGSRLESGSLTSVWRSNATRSTTIGRQDGWSATSKVNSLALTEIINNVNVNK